LKQRLHPAGKPDRVGRTNSGPPTSPPTGEKRARRATLIAAIVTGAIAIAVYLPAIAFDFVRDDRELLLEGSLVRAPGTLLHLLASDYWSAAAGTSGLWRPCAVFTLWVDGRLSGWSPTWFHTANLLAHGFTTFLLALAVSTYGGGLLATWVAGLWFALMPAHVESVAWIVGRTDVWCGLLALAALILARDGPAGRRLAPVAFALALLSKETAAAMAPVFALAAWVDARGSWPAWRRACLPYLVVLAVWAALHALLVPPSPASAGSAVAGPARFWTALALPAWELRFLLPGVGHGPDWMIAPIAGPAPAAWIGLGVRVAVAVLLTALAVRRDALAIPLAIAWCPLIAMTFLAFGQGTVFSGERHVYLASAGAAWAVALWIERSRSSRVIPVALAAVVVLLAWSARDTIATIPAWKDEETMYDTMARTEPMNPTGPLGQALARIDRGDDAGAWEALERAAAIDSTRFEIPLYRSGIELRGGRPAVALALAHEAGARVGWNRDARLIEALALQRLGRWIEARNVLEDLSAHERGDSDVRSAWRAQLAGEARAAGPAREPSR
jgi:protein O-mannosyl-transferase